MVSYRDAPALRWDALAEQCAACQRAGLRTYAAALQARGLHAEGPHLQALLDCAEVCELTAALLLRRSSLTAQVLRVCAAAAGRCAEDCGQPPASAERTACAADCWELATALAG
jgi:hypothetical protein